MMVMTPAGPPMTWVRLSGPSGSLPCLPERLRMAMVMSAATAGAVQMPATNGAGGAQLEQFGADQAVHDIAPAVLVSEKKTSSRFDSSRRIS